MTHDLALVTWYAGGLQAIYVVDVRNGLYVLRYHGRWAGQVDEESFLEGNSNL